MITAKGSKAEDKVCKKCGRVFTTDWIDKRINYKLQEQAKEIKKELERRRMPIKRGYDIWEYFWEKYCPKEEGK